MSSTRRTANEIHILAMLDRHEAGGLTRRFLRGLRGRAARFSYGAAGVLVCGLVGTLAWLAQDGGTAVAVDAALADAVSPGPADRQAGAAIAPLALPASPAAAAADAVADGAADTLAVTLPDAASEEAPKGAAIVDAAPAPAAVPVTPPAARTPAQQEQAGHGPLRPARTKPGAGIHTPRTPRAPALAHADARARRPVQPSKAAPAAVDTDVALISAIIQHANKRQEAEDAAGKP